MSYLFKKGDVVFYPKDYQNTKFGENLSGEDFQQLIKEHFPKYIAELEETTGWGKTFYKYVPFIYDENGKELLHNKGYICVKEATKDEEGLLIGVHDFTNRTHIINKLES